MSVAEERMQDPPRLLDGIVGDSPATLDDHLACYGPLALRDPGDLIAALEASGLQGRGGAGFPTGTKLRAVAARHGHPIVVANGVEGEPVSGKDKVLLHYLPHLVLDGIVTAAVATGAREAIVAVADSAVREARIVEAAIKERRARGLDKRIALGVVEVPDGFVAGEETALVQFVNRGIAKPTFTPPRPYERGVGGAPTLIQNVETLAHLALIARHGPAWFRSLGTPDEPGSMLVTLSGAVGVPGVYEVPLGTPLRMLIQQAGGVSERPRAILLGGYFGRWVDAGRAAETLLSQASLERYGARLGARAIVVLPISSCGICETARVLRYLAESSAGQCGPCVHGLDAIADAFERLSTGGGIDGRLGRWVEQVRGRGACRHPDGAAALAASALHVFTDETRLHLVGRCPGDSVDVLPVPPANGSGRQR